MLRALLLDRAGRVDPPSALLVGRDGAALLGRRTAHLIGTTADLAVWRDVRATVVTSDTVGDVW